MPTAVVYSATKGALDTATRVLAKELGPKNDMAKVAVFLASAASGWMTGETIAVGGGYS
jgi:NAD(P)-dependent dehydrogenase (short-subunit alcohol dehydrogenase family)